MSQTYLPANRQTPRLEEITAISPPLCQRDKRPGTIVSAMNGEIKTNNEINSWKGRTGFVAGRPQKCIVGKASVEPMRWQWRPRWRSVTGSRTDLTRKEEEEVMYWRALAITYWPVVLTASKFKPMLARICIVLFVSSR